MDFTGRNGSHGKNCLFSELAFFDRLALVSKGKVNNLFIVKKTAEKELYTTID